MDYFRKATNTSPTVMMDSKTKSVLISGSSLCRDVTIYASVINDMIEQFEQFDYKDLNIKLNVFNTIAAKSLIDLLKSFKFKSKAPSIHWYFDKKDREMQEMANDYSELLEMEFELSDN
ncbi:SiaC family regulatory phosphoprotein [Ekhidna sp.]|uniref:SiaC family regulatory phosphoprotein n=1 Tax=Ekhidna sp. TaxID=2608089 RepID=UPI003C7BD800